MSTSLNDKPTGTGTGAYYTVPRETGFLQPALDTRRDPTSGHEYAHGSDNTSSDGTPVQDEFKANTASSASVPREKISSGPQFGRYYTGDSAPDDEKVMDNNTPQKLSDERGEVLGNPNGMSWPQVAALLGAEYISLAILSFPWSYSYLGLVGGVLVTLAVQGIVTYTSITLWKFCLMNPGVKHVCDIGQILFGGHQIFYELTMVGLLLNNLFIQALHCLTGSIMLNTLSEHGLCTIAFSGIIAAVCAIATLPRTFSQISWLGWASAISIVVSVIVSMVFAAIQDSPAGYVSGPIKVSATATTTDFIEIFNAVLNITYTLVGQITIPSFIGDMKDPRDFPKALYAIAAVEMILMIAAGVEMYVYFGQYTAAPAIGSLRGNYSKIGYGLAFPAVIVIGVIYSSVLCQFLYLRFTKGTRHALDAEKQGNTTTGWLIWTALVVGSWVLGFIIAECIPFFSDLLSVMSSLFDSFFGFIFWGVAFFQITPRRRWFSSPLRILESSFNILIVCLGIMILCVGTWTSIASIIRSYAAGTVGSPFTCADNAVQAAA